MQAHVYLIGTTRTKLQPDPDCTAIIFQNIDANISDYIYIAEFENENPAVAGLRLSGGGSTLTLRKAWGEEPEKGFSIVGSAAATPMRVLKFYGKPTIAIDSTIEPPGPQEPEAPGDAPLMR